VGELGHRSARVGLDETRLHRGSFMELSQAQHALVLVAKGAEVGDAQRC
jgi:hypothetical protein